MESQELLAHADFVRALARRLLLDEDQAADVAQQTWLAALEGRPDTDRPIKAWLARVTRNLSIKLRLGEARRARREWAVAEPDRAPSTEEVVEREEIRSRVVEAVLDLKEPYRSTILLRYYEDLPVAKVAVAQGVPLETVRTRIKRGLDHLRQHLDHQHGGDRGAWCLALTPVAGMALTPPAAGAAAVAAGSAAADSGSGAATGSTAGQTVGSGVGSVTGSTTGSTAGSVLGTTVVMKLGITALVIIGGAIALWQLVTPEADEPAPAGAAAFEEQAAATDREGEQQTAGYAALEEGELIMTRVVPSAKAFISGRVLEPSGGPAKAYFADLWRREGPWLWKSVVSQAIRNEDGRFDFPIEEGGRYFLLIRTSRHRPLVVKDIPVPERKGVAGLGLGLRTDCSLSGRVVDDRTGQPVAGVSVLPTHGTPNAFMGSTIVRSAFGTDAYLEWSLLDRPECCIHGKTDADGCFTLSGLDGRVVRIAALPTDRLAGSSIKVNPRSGEEVELRLVPGHHVYGRVLDDFGEPLPGALVRVWGYVSIPVVTDEDGSYRTPPLPDGPVTLSASLPEVGQGSSLQIDRWESTQPNHEKSTQSNRGESTQPNLGESTQPNRQDWTEPNRQDSMEATGGGRAFTPEIRQTVLAGGDAKVDFGPGPDHVTWRGVFRDTRGVPVAGGTISLHRSSRDAGFFERRVRCDGEGRFTFRKLSPGAYNVGLACSGQDTGYTSLGTVTFEKAGEIEKDLGLYGGVIQGAVLDRATKKALKRPDCYVKALGLRSARPFTCHLDGEGNFHLLGLFPDVYALTVHGPGLVGRPVHGIEVGEGEILGGLSIEVAQGGRFMVNLLRDHPIRLILQKEGDPVPFCNRELSFGYGTSAKNSFTMDLLPGSWTARVVSDALGEAVKSFQLKPGDTCTMILNRDVFSLPGTSIGLAGTVTFGTGCSAPGIRLEFLGRDLPVQGAVKQIVAYSDGSGLFSADGFFPGRWEVTACTVTAPLAARSAARSEMTCRLSDLIIPEGAAGPFSCDLIIPTGRLRARLMDSATGLPLGEEVKWQVQLLDAAGGRPIATVPGGCTGPDLALGNLPEGAYRLFIRAVPYENLGTELFTVGSEGAADKRATDERGTNENVTDGGNTNEGITNLGDLFLRPAGVLVLKIQGAGGRRLEGIAMEFPDREGPDAPIRFTQQGLSYTADMVSWCYSIPTPGPVRIRVGSGGFLYKEERVKVPPGTTLEVPMILNPDPYMDHRF